jgi:hypothetical protein
MLALKILPSSAKSSVCNGQPHEEGTARQPTKCLNSSARSLLERAYSIRL